MALKKPLQLSINDNYMLFSFNYRH